MMKKYTIYIFGHPVGREQRLFQGRKTIAKPSPWILSESKCYDWFVPITWYQMMAAISKHVGKKKVYTDENPCLLELILPLIINASHEIKFIFFVRASTRADFVTSVAFVHTSIQSD